MIEPASQSAASHDAVSHGALPHDAVSHGAAPHGAAPQGAAPHGAAPQGAAPHREAPAPDASHQRLAAATADPAALWFTIRFLEGILGPEDTSVVSANLERLAAVSPDSLPAAVRAALRAGGVVGAGMPGVVAPVARRAARQLISPLFVEGPVSKLGDEFAGIRAAGDSVAVSPWGAAVLGQRGARSVVAESAALLARDDVGCVTVSASQIASGLSLWQVDDSVQRVAAALEALVTGEPPIGAGSTGADGPRVGDGVPPAAVRDAVGGGHILMVESAEPQFMGITAEAVRLVLQNSRFDAAEIGLNVDLSSTPVAPLLAAAAERRERGGVPFTLRVTDIRDLRSLLEGPSLFDALPLHGVDAESRHGGSHVDPSRYAGSQDGPSRFAGSNDDLSRTGSRDDPSRQAVDEAPTAPAGLHLVFAPPSLAELADGWSFVSHHGYSTMVRFEVPLGLPAALLHAIRADTGGLVISVPWVREHGVSGAVPHLVGRLTAFADAGYLTASWPPAAADPAPPAAESLSTADSATGAPVATAPVAARPATAGPDPVAAEASVAGSVSANPGHLTGVPVAAGPVTSSPLTVAAADGVLQASGAGGAAPAKEGVLRRVAVELESRRAELRDAIVHKTGMLEQDADACVTTIIRSAESHADLARLRRGIEGATFTPSAAPMVAGPVAAGQESLVAAVDQTFTSVAAAIDVIVVTSAVHAPGSSTSMTSSSASAPLRIVLDTLWNSGVSRDALTLTDDLSELQTIPIDRAELALLFATNPASTTRGGAGAGERASAASDPGTTLTEPSATKRDDSSFANLVSGFDDSMHHSDRRDAAGKFAGDRADAPHPAGSAQSRLDNLPRLSEPIDADHLDRPNNPDHPDRPGHPAHPAHPDHPGNSAHPDHPGNSAHQPALGAAAIVTPTADLDQAARDIVSGAFADAGQGPTATRLVILVGSVAKSEHFRAQLVDAVESLKPGFGGEPAARMGPLVAPASAAQLAALTRLHDGETWWVTPRQCDDEGRLWSPGIRAGAPVQSTGAEPPVAAPMIAVLQAATIVDAVALQNSFGHRRAAAIHSQSSDEIDGWVSHVDADELSVNCPTVEQPAPRFATLLEHGSWADDPGEPSADLSLATLAPAVRELLSAVTTGLDWAEFDVVRRSALADDAAWHDCLAERSDAGSAEQSTNTMPDPPSAERSTNATRLFRPVHTVIRLADAAPLRDLVRVLSAASRAAAPVTVSSSQKLPRPLRALLKDRGVKVFIEDDSLFLQRAPSLADAASGFRMIGGDHIALRAALAGHSATVFAHPVTRAGLLELLPFLRQQNLLQHSLQQSPLRAEEMPTPA